MLAPVATLAVIIISAPDEDFSVLHRAADGLVLQARATPDTAFGELRLLAHSTASPQALADVVWSGVELADEQRYLSARHVLSQNLRFRLERQVLDAPLVGRRHSWVRFLRHVDRFGAISIEYAQVSVDEYADAPPMRVQRGCWLFIPDGGGGTAIEFRMVAEPGGIPVFLASGVQRSLVLALVRGAIHRAEAQR